MGEMGLRRRVLGVSYAQSPHSSLLALDPPHSQYRAVPQPGRTLLSPCLSPLPSPLFTHLKGLCTSDLLSSHLLYPISQACMSSPLKLGINSPSLYSISQRLDTPGGISEQEDEQSCGMNTGLGSSGSVMK